MKNWYYLILLSLWRQLWRDAFYFARWRMKMCLYEIQRVERESMWIGYGLKAGHYENVYVKCTSQRIFPIFWLFFKIITLFISNCFTCLVSSHFSFFPFYILLNFFFIDFSSVSFILFFIQTFISFNCFFIFFHKIILFFFSCISLLLPPTFPPHSFSLFSPSSFLSLSIFLFFLFLL